MRGFGGDGTVFRMSFPIGLSVFVGCLATALLLRKGAQYYQSQVSQRKRIELRDKTAAPPTTKCHVCNNLLNIDSPIVCDGCKQQICRQCAVAGSSGVPNASSPSWNCKLCNSFLKGSHTACDWLLQQLNQRFASRQSEEAEKRFVDKRHSNETTKEADRVGGKSIEWNSSDDTLFVTTEQRDVVREYIEELVASMVGSGSLDNVPISQLYSNLSCLPRTATNEADLDDSYANLKNMVERIIEQVFKIPEMIDLSGTGPRELASTPVFDPKKYEELLATAVLNKIVEKFEKEQIILRQRRGSTISSEELSAGRLSHSIGQQRMSDSSDEPRSDDSGQWQRRFNRPMSLIVTSSDPGYNDSGFMVGSMPTSPTSDEEYLSDYIQNHRVPLPQLNADDLSTEGQLDDVFTSIGSNGTAESDWQENWLFKKSAINTHETMTNPIGHIGMLVPSPTEDVKAQIGDQTTDEVSDLSEAGSDVESDLSDTEPTSVPYIVQPDSLISQTNSSGPIQEATNELVLLSERGKPQLIEDINEIQLSEEEIQRSLETLDAVVYAAERAEENSANHDEAQVPVVVSATKSIEKTKEIEDTVPVPREISILSVSQHDGLADTKPETRNLTNNLQSPATIPNPSLAFKITKLEAETSFIVFPSDNDSPLPPIPPLFTHPLWGPMSNQNSLVLNDNLRTIPSMDSPPTQSSVDFLKPLIQKYTINHPITTSTNNNHEHSFDDAIEKEAEDRNSNTVEDLTTPQIAYVCRLPAEIQPVIEIPQLPLQPHLQEYICKVSPTEYDLSLDAAVDTSLEFKANTSISEKILSVDLASEDNSVPKAISICSKPALLAIDLTSNSSEILIENVKSDFYSDSTPSQNTSTAIEAIADDKEQSDSITEAAISNLELITEPSELSKAILTISATPILPIFSNMKLNSANNPTIDNLELIIPNPSPELSFVSDQDPNLVLSTESVISNLELITPANSSLPIVSNLEIIIDHILVNVINTESAISNLELITEPSDITGTDKAIGNTQDLSIIDNLELVVDRNPTTNVNMDAAISNLEILTESSDKATEIQDSSAPPNVSDSNLDIVADQISANEPSISNLELITQKSDGTPTIGAALELLTISNLEIIVDQISSKDVNSEAVVSNLILITEPSEKSKNIPETRVSSELPIISNLELKIDQLNENHSGDSEQTYLQTIDNLELIIPNPLPDSLLISDIQIPIETVVSNTTDLPEISESTPANQAIQSAPIISNLELLVPPEIGAIEKLTESNLPTVDTLELIIPNPLPDSLLISDDITSKLDNLEIVVGQNPLNDYNTETAVSNLELIIEQQTISNLELLVETLLTDPIELDNSANPNALIDNLEIVIPTPSIDAVQSSADANDLRSKISSPITEPFIATVKSEAGIEWMLPENNLDETASIPTLVVSEADDQSVSNDHSSKGKQLIAQDSLEIPEIDSRENCGDLIKAFTTNVAPGESVIAPDSPTDIADDFVVVTDDEVRALQFEEQDTQARLSPDTSILLPLLTALKSDISAPTVTTSSSSTNLISTTNLEHGVIDIVSPVEEVPASTKTDEELSIELRPRNDDGDLLGSIAEREHQKWKNAEDIPNNPYSPEALQKRLTSQWSRDFDLQRLVSKSHEDSAKSHLDVPVPSEEVPVEPRKPDIARYGRDYYINDSKSANGIRSPTHSDWNSTTSPEQHYRPDSNKPVSISDSEIFKATPVVVREAQSEENSCETVLTSVEDFSHQQTSAADSSLTPSEESDSTRVYDLNNRQTRILRNDIIRTSRLPAQEPTRSLSPTSSSRRPQSTTDVKFEQLDQFKRAIEPSWSSSSSRTVGTGCSSSPPIGLSQSVQARPSSNLQQFAVAPKAKRIATFPFAKMEVDPPQPNHHHPHAETLLLNGDSHPPSASSVEEYQIPMEEAPKPPSSVPIMHDDDDVATSPAEPDYLVSYNEPIIVSKPVIEEDVLPALPSVKALAQGFIKLRTTIDETPINRPKSLHWQNHPTSNGDSNNAETPLAFQPIPRQTLTFPVYNQGYHPVNPGHSITARNLSSQFREELRTSNRDDQYSPAVGHSSPERPSSPVLVPGILKSNIAFFENLTNKH